MEKKSPFTLAEKIKRIGINVSRNLKPERRRLQNTPERHKSRLGQMDRCLLLHKDVNSPPY